MVEAVERCLLISDFNVSNLRGYLENSEEAPAVRASEAPFGQVMSTLLDPGSEVWTEKHDVALVWTRPEGVIESFQSVLDCRDPVGDRLLEEVDRFVDALLGMRGRVPLVLVPTWVVPTWHRGLGLGDWQDGGVSLALGRINLRLAERLRQERGFYVLDARKWIETAGPQAFNPKYWYMGKIAFGNEVFKSAIADIKAAMRAGAGQSRKLIVLDLDDTLWGGIVGEVGWEGVKLGGHDPIGEAFVDFQRALKSFQNRGLILAIVSRNEESVALEAIREHPEMVLRLEDFAGWRINWQDKAQNLVDLVEELNLGLQSVVFIDDSPAERGRVREALPEVLVPEWPEDKMLYRQTLVSLDYFDTAAVSDEDRQRTGMYVSERQRRDLRSSVASVEQWLASLELNVTVEPLNVANLQRVTQLLNKTNQMNLSTRRLTETELAAWADADHRVLWSFRVADRFGDSGITGITSVEHGGSVARIVDFVLSCRVFGRGIERLMAHTVVAHAREIGAEVVEARYLPTAKNKPCLEFWKKSGFEPVPAGDLFRWPTDRPYPPPDFMTVSGRAEEARAAIDGKQS